MREIEVDELTWIRKWVKRLRPWREIAEDLKRCRTPEQAMLIPGCNVKTVEREEKSPHFPKDFGKLIVLSEHEVIVACHGTRMVLYKMPLVIWTGTPLDYFVDWFCD